MQGMLVNQSEFSCVLGMKNTEKRWHVYINIQKYVLPVYLGTTCVRTKVALLKALHSCRKRCLDPWDRRQLPSLLHFQLWLLHDSISVFSAVWQSEPCPLWDLGRYKVKKKKLLLLWLTIEKCFYSATAQINKTAWRVEGSTLKYMCHQQYYWTISICSLKQLRDLATAGVVFGGHQKFTLTYTFTLRNIKHLSFPPSNIICLLVDILVIIISLVTDSLLVFVYDFRAIDLVLIRILHWSLLRANKATFFYKRCLISRTSLFQWTAQYNILEAWCPVRTQCSNTFWFQIWY